MIIIFIFYIQYSTLIHELVFFQMKKKRIDDKIDCERDSRQKTRYIDSNIIIVIESSFLVSQQFIIKSIINQFDLKIDQISTNVYDFDTFYCFIIKFVDWYHNLDLYIFYSTRKSYHWYYFVILDVKFFSILLYDCSRQNLNLRHLSIYCRYFYFHRFTLCEKINCREKKYFWRIINFCLSILWIIRSRNQKMCFWI